MGHVNATQFKKLADAVASDFVTQGIPLNDSVRKLASSMSMNNEQVKRLCEASNNATFNQLFQNKEKTASDRIVEFDVADPDKVLGGLIQSSEPAEVKTASLYEYRELEEVSVLDKVAAVAEEVDVVLPLREADKRTMRKAISHLSTEKIAWDMQYTDGINELNNTFKKIYNPLTFDEFEKVAMAIHGDAALPEINALRRLQRKEVLTKVPYTKTASYVDDTNAAYQTLKELMELRKKTAQAVRAIHKLEGAL